MSVTLVVAAINAQRPRHYTAGDSSFEGDYIYSLKQVLKLFIFIFILSTEANALYRGR